MASTGSATNLRAGWSAPALPTWGNSYSFSDLDLFATESHHDMYSQDWLRVQVITLMGADMAVTVEAIQITRLYAKVLVAFIYIYANATLMKLCDLQSFCRN